MDEGFISGGLPEQTSDIFTTGGESDVMRGVQVQLGKGSGRPCSRRIHGKAGGGSLRRVPEPSHYQYAVKKRTGILAYEA